MHPKWYIFLGLVAIVTIATISISFGKIDSAPGQTGDAPGLKGRTPGQAEATPGQSGEEPPGQGGYAPPGKLMSMPCDDGMVLCGGECQETCGEGDSCRTEGAECAIITNNPCIAGICTDGECVAHEVPGCCNPTCAPGEYC